MKNINKNLRERLKYQHYQTKQDRPHGYIIMVYTNGSTMERIVTFDFRVHNMGTPGTNLRGGGAKGPHIGKES